MVSVTTKLRNNAILSPECFIAACAQWKMRWTPAAALNPFCTQLQSWKVSELQACCSLRSCGALMTDGVFHKSGISRLNIRTVYKNQLGRPFQLQSAVCITICLHREEKLLLLNQCYTKTTMNAFRSVFNTGFIWSFVTQFLYELKGIVYTYSLSGWEWDKKLIPLSYPSVKYPMNLQHGVG